jgi:hypothetical protein
VGGILLRRDFAKGFFLRRDFVERDFAAEPSNFHQIENTRTKNKRLRHQGLTHPQNSRGFGPIWNHMDTGKRKPFASKIHLNTNDNKASVKTVYGVLHIISIFVILLPNYKIN